MNKKIRKRIIACITITFCILSSLSFHAISLADEQSNAFNDGRCFDFILQRDPITQIVLPDGSIVNYIYDGDQLIEKTFKDLTTTYIYDDFGNLVEENGAAGKIRYLYEKDEDVYYCIGLEYLEQVFYFVYDDLSNVIQLVDTNGTPICSYDYNSSFPKVYEYVDGDLIENSDVNFIGNINSIRLNSWHYEAESGYFYTGGGVFYDAEQNHFIMNDAELIFPDGQPRALNRIQEYYKECINSSTFSESISNVSESDWNRGKRWYDGLSDTQIAARTIIAENGYDGTGPSRDRTAIACVVANRVRNKYQGTSLMSVLTKASQFSSVNPGKYGACNAARQERSPSNSIWQQCVMLACVLHYSSTLSDISEEYAIPAGISNQLHFYSVSSVINNSTFTISGGKMYQNGKELTLVAIPGEGELSINTTSKNTLLQTYKKHNLFYSYK